MINALLEKVYEIVKAPFVMSVHNKRGFAFDNIYEIENM